MGEETSVRDGVLRVPQERAPQAELPSVEAAGRRRLEGEPPVKKREGLPVVASVGLKALEDMIRMSVMIITGDTTAVNALFDTGANVSLVSQALMKRLRLAVGLQSEGAVTINEQPILTYGSVELDISVTDSEGMSREQRHILVTAEIG